MPARTDMPDPASARTCRWRRSRRSYSATRTSAALPSNIVRDNSGCRLRQPECGVAGLTSAVTEQRDLRPILRAKRPGRTGRHAIGGLAIGSLGIGSLGIGSRAVIPGPIWRGQTCPARTSRPSKRACSARCGSPASKPLGQAAMACVTAGCWAPPCPRAAPMPMSESACVVPSNGQAQFARAGPMAPLSG